MCSVQNKKETYNDLIFTWIPPSNFIIIPAGSHKLSFLVSSWTSISKFLTSSTIAALQTKIANRIPANNQILVILINFNQISYPDKFSALIQMERTLQHLCIFWFHHFLHWTCPDWICPVLRNIRCPYGTSRWEELQCRWAEVEVICHFDFQVHKILCTVSPSHSRQVWKFLDFHWQYCRDTKDSGSHRNLRNHFHQLFHWWFLAISIAKIYPWRSL